MSSQDNNQTPAIRAGLEEGLPLTFRTPYGGCPASDSNLAAGPTRVLGAAGVVTMIP
jgi:hypothetical protein